MFLHQNVNTCGLNTNPLSVGITTSRTSFLRMFNDPFTSALSNLPVLERYKPRCTRSPLKTSCFSIGSPSIKLAFEVYDSSRCINRIPFRVHLYSNIAKNILRGIETKLTCVSLSFLFISAAHS